MEKDFKVYDIFSDGELLNTVFEPLDSVRTLTEIRSELIKRDGYKWNVVVKLRITRPGSTLTKRKRK